MRPQGQRAYAIRLLQLTYLCWPLAIFYDPQLESARLFRHKRPLFIRGL